MDWLGLGDVVVILMLSS